MSPMGRNPPLVTPAIDSHLEAGLRRPHACTQAVSQNVQYRQILFTVKIGGVEQQPGMLQWIGFL